MDLVSQEDCCDVAWVQARAMGAMAAASAAVSIGQVERLEKFVSDASGDVDRRLIDLLFNTFSLAKHCDAMRRYVLLGQGDFVQVRVCICMCVCTTFYSSCFE